MREKVIVATPVGLLRRPITNRGGDGDDDDDDDDDGDDDEGDVPTESHALRNALLALLAFGAVVGAWAYWNRKPAEPSGGEGVGGGGGGSEVETPTPTPTPTPSPTEPTTEPGKQAVEDANTEDAFDADRSECAAGCRAKGDHDAACVFDCIEARHELDREVRRAAEEAQRDAERSVAEREAERTRTEAERQRAQRDADALALESELHPKDDDKAYVRVTKEAERKRRESQWNPETDRDEAKSALQACRYRARHKSGSGVLSSDEERQCAERVQKREHDRGARRQVRGVLVENEQATHMSSPDGLIQTHVGALGFGADFMTHGATGRPQWRALDVPAALAVPQDAPKLPPERMREGYHVTISREAVVSIVFKDGDVRLRAALPPGVPIDLRAPKRLTLDNEGVFRVVELRASPEGPRYAPREHVLCEWPLKFRWPPAPYNKTVNGSNEYIEVGDFYQLDRPSLEHVLAPPVDAGKSNGAFVYRLDQLSAVRVEFRHVEDPRALEQASQQQSYDKFFAGVRRVDPRAFDYFGYSLRPIRALPDALKNGDLVFCYTESDPHADRVFFLQRGQRRLLENPQQDMRGYTNASRVAIDCPTLDSIDRGPNLPRSMPGEVKNSTGYRCVSPEDGTVRVYHIEQEHKRRFVHSQPPVASKDYPIATRECSTLNLVPDGPDI